MRVVYKTSGQFRCHSLSLSISLTTLCYTLLSRILNGFILLKSRSPNTLQLQSHIFLTFSQDDSKTLFLAFVSLQVPPERLPSTSSHGITTFNTKSLQHELKMVVQTPTTLQYRQPVMAEEYVTRVDVRLRINTNRPSPEKTSSRAN